MKLSRQAIDRPRITLVAAALILLGAFYAATEIPVQRTPAINTAVVIVAVPYAGSKPNEVEEEISRKIEDSLGRLDRVDWMESTSMRGSSVTAVVFLDGVDSKQARDDVAHLVNEVRNELPSGREVIPSIVGVDFESMPIMLVTLVGHKNFDDRALKTIAEEVQDELESISGVANTALYGGRTREIHVNYHPDLLAQYGLTMPELRQALLAGHTALPSGSLNTDRFNLQVRVDGKFQTLDEIRDEPIREFQGRIVRVRDVAEVVDSFRRPISLAQLDGLNSATILVNKEPNINTLATAQMVKAHIEELRLKYPEVDFHATRDSSEEIALMFEVLGSSALWGGILVVVILQLSMGFRASCMVLLAIPISTAVALVFLYVTGAAISNMVIFSYILVLGMVVDGAIIVVENIHRHIEMGKSPEQAAKDGIDEVGLPVIAADLTTVAAYAPMLLVPGIMGDFMGVMPRVVAMALVGSVMVDHFLIPVVASMWYRQKAKSDEASQAPRQPPPPGRFTRGYLHVLNYALANRLMVVCLCGVGLVWAGWMLASGAIETEFFPPSDRGQFQVAYELPLGYSIEESLRAAKTITDPLEELRESGVLRHYVTAVGSGGSLAGPVEGDNAAGPEFGKIMVELTPPTERSRHQDEIIAELREKIRPWPGMKYRIATVQEGPPGGADIEVRLTGDNLEDLGRMAKRISTEMATIRGAVEVSTDYRPDNPEIRIEPRPGVLGLFGMNKQMLSLAAGVAIQGDQQIELVMEDEEVTLRLQALSDYQRYLNDVQRLMITSPVNGRRATIGELAEVRREQGLFAIRRRDRRRAVSVRANVLGTDVAGDEGNTSNGIFGELRRRLPELGFRPGGGSGPGKGAFSGIRRLLYEPSAENAMTYLGQPGTEAEGVRAVFTGKDEEKRENFGHLNVVMILAVFLIGFILVVQFNSIRQSAIVLGTIPLSFIGVVLGMWLFGFPFSLASFIGLVSLAGVVVNDAIVMVDFSNQAVRRGLSIDDALRDAGRNRFRPVLLTTVTTIGGLLPMFLNITGGAEFWQPLTGAVISGLAFATALTLIVIPVAYSLVYTWHPQAVRSSAPATAA